jgi:hypothetical protein
MVFPAQNPTVSSITPSENLPLLETPGAENASESREEVTELFLTTQELVSENKGQDPNKGTEQPGPGQIVNLSTNHKVSDTSVQTPDKVTTIADWEEKKFREEVDATAHEQHH